MMRTGLIGTTVAALCCFTPLAVWGLGAIGLAAGTAYLDLVALPALIFFAGLTGYALWRRQTSSWSRR